MNNILQAQVMAVEERLRQAQLHNDVNALDQLVSPELLFTTHIGQLASKADDLALHRARALRLEKAEPSEERIHIYDGFAVVSVLMHLVGTYENMPIDQHIRYTRVWAPSAEGNLQIVAGHMSEVQSS